jgi:hypothetical protein
MEEPDADSEKQLLPPAAIGVGYEALPRAGACGPGGRRHLRGARGVRAPRRVRVAACQLLLLHVAAGAVRVPRGQRPLRQVGSGAQVLQWSLAMALPMSMVFSVVQSAPAAVGAALVGLALPVVFACYIELVRSLYVACAGTSLSATSEL